MKVCSKCGTKKPLSEYHMQSKSRRHITDGYRAACRTCTNGENRDSWCKHVDRRRAKKAEYRSNNPDKIKKAYRDHYDSNKQPNRDKSIKRRDILRRSTINGGSPFTIVSPFAKIARRMTIETGVKYSVDHIVPLQGEKVSGLNVPWNIQVIPLLDNIRKYNKLVGYGS